MSIKHKIAGVVAGMAAIALLAGCSSSATPEAGKSADADKVIKIGVVGASDPYWATYTEEAKKAGINIEIKNFTEYPQVNPALTNGDVDINQFQHLIYLAQYNVGKGEDLTPIGSTAIYPLPLYSKKFKDVKDIPEGATIAIPNDDSNQARALLTLQGAGLVKLKDGGSIVSKADDIEDGSKVKVITVDGSLAPQQLDDPAVAGAVINNDFASKAGIDINSAIAKDSADDPKSQAYVNVFAVRAKDKDNETYKKLVDIYQNSQAVLDGVQKVSGGTAVFAKIPAADLEKTLADVEKTVKASK
ncbi:methionine ABC transporter substrate-binding protein [Mycetocola tolaasinivorans]|uniref:Methionine ABC transporter substrate-binding protein n=1 Tax=Mycetocola tolaasinivorans TaxID=76635 RepID=A0A3L7A155_9MICO|nr:MetQ/NlpA family ABC transporter substrate-binding protein [Mycetocola tolaasinivorans]RLP73695.1 methionine ABC transporter substrate-binding protein [Mycetocola tolaasinivorans]